MIRGSLEWKTKHYSLFVFLLPARQTVQPLFNADLRTTMEITMTTMTMTKTLMMMLRWWMITIITPVVPPAAAARAPPQFAEDAPARLCWPPTCKASHWLNADGVGENLNSPSWTNNGQWSPSFDWLVPSPRQVGDSANGCGRRQGGTQRKIIHLLSL